MGLRDSSESPFTQTITMNPREYRLLSRRMSQLDSEISQEKKKPKKDRHPGKLSVYLKLKNTVKEWMKS